MLQRVGLFILMNLAVLLLVRIVVGVFGIDFYLSQQGLNLQLLLVWSFLFGMAGSFISLMASKWMAKRFTGAEVIERPRNSTESWLVNTVHMHAQAAGIAQPEVCIYDSPEPNAFATGPSRSNSLVAVSTGLLRAMNEDEASAVLGHEVSHIANGDMVTMALLQGVLNTFVYFLSTVIGYLVDRVVFKNEEGVGIGYYVVTIAAQLVLGVLASIVLAWFSRRREFRADAGGARLAGTNKMIGALQALKRSMQPSELPEQMAAFGISGSGRRGLMALLASHPPLDDRIAALRERG
jgi:heat shock protein HtpX